MKRTSVKKGDIATLTRAARLNLPAERAALLAETMGAIFQVLESLDAIELCETPPACHYRFRPSDAPSAKRRFFGSRRLMKATPTGVPVSRLFRRAEKL
ncbi:MAG: hypothetical protein CFH10_01661 [Alphaproteobacteria bacterium MarineAlpha4_Bin2]|nr:MAG: hypothetical protein CFH10_01661 [Alphaproteobacteria bacterium MarineAlpha4_Bin2]